MSKIRRELEALRLENHSLKIQVKGQALTISSLEETADRLYAELDEITPVMTGPPDFEDEDEL